MSQNAQIYNNTLEGNFGGIQYFLNCDSLALGEDVKNNAAYDNTVVVGTQSYAYASGFSYLSSCTSTQVAPYLNGSKNLTFSRNAYRVPSLSGRYMLWGGWKYWNEWQALGQDVDGSMIPVAARGRGVAPSARMMSDPKRRAGVATMHSALRIRSANASPASAGHRRCHPQLAVALVASIFGGVTGLVVDLAAQAPRPPSNVRILGDGVVARRRLRQVLVRSPALPAQLGASASHRAPASKRPSILMRVTPRSVCAPACTLSDQLDQAEDGAIRLSANHGAILDGSGWSTADDTQAAFRAHNEDIDYVTIRNLVIRNMPQRASMPTTGCPIIGRSNTTRLPPTKCGLVFGPISPSGTITSTTTWAMPRRRIPPSGVAAT